MIKGLSDRLRLPRRGKIRLGEKVVSEKTGKEFPKALDYFVCPDEVKKVYGEKPRKLDIMLPMENVEHFFPQYYKRYGSSKGLVCKGDGEVAVEMDEDGMREIECPGKDCPYYQKGECKQIGNLQVILPKIKGLGVYQIDTSSYNSIVNLNSGIEMIRGMLGRVSWVPLILEVQMQEAHPLVNGKKIKTIIPVMSITSDVSVQDLLKMRAPRQEAVIDNPGMDEFPELLYPTVAEKETVELEKDEETGLTIPGKKGMIDNGEKKESEPKTEKKKKESRNQLNIRFHVLKKRLFEIDYFADDGSYRAWLEEMFGKKSSKELENRELEYGIEVMANIFNKHRKESK